MRKYLGEWRGELCVVEEDPSYNEPTMMILYWPTGIQASDFRYSYGDELMGNLVQSAGTGGAYSIIGVPRLQVHLVHGGKTKAIHVETRKIPPPKVRKGTELRYKEGGWQKYLKTRGWVKVPLDWDSVKSHEK